MDIMRECRFYWRFRISSMLNSRSISIGYCLDAFALTIVEWDIIGKGVRIRECHKISIYLNVELKHSHSGQNEESIDSLLRPE